MKKVTFNEQYNKTYKLYTWDYAYKSARKKFWEFFAIDRMRFKNRINVTACVINPILNCEHRYKVYLERFNKTLL